VLNDIEQKLLNAAANAQLLTIDEVFLAPYMIHFSYRIIDFGLNIPIDEIRHMDDGALLPSLNHRPPYPSHQRMVHHSHPYFAIQNALHKFQAHEHELHSAHQSIFEQLKFIQLLWERMHPDPDRDSRAHDDETANPQICVVEDHASSIPALTANDDDDNEPIDETGSQVSDVDSEMMQHIEEWMMTLGGDVLKDPEQLARSAYSNRDDRQSPPAPPTHDWHDWRPEWESSPPDRSQFSTNDWAYYFTMTCLPREPYQYRMERQEYQRTHASEFKI